MNGEKRKGNRKTKNQQIFFKSGNYSLNIFNNENCLIKISKWKLMF